MKYDCGGYATRSNIRCTDGRIILPNAFAHQDGAKVPFVWQHRRDEPENVLGHAVLENRKDGVYAYLSFNDQPKSKHVKALVEHGDIDSLSIYAIDLKEAAKQVTHGLIKEVSIVYAGANSGAFIDNLAIVHGDGTSTELADEAIITPTEEDYIEHDVEYSPGDSASDTDDSDKDNNDKLEHAVNDSLTVKQIMDSMNDTQREFVYALTGNILAAKEMEHGADTDDDLQHSSDNGGNNMKVNVFESNAAAIQGPVLNHEDVRAIFSSAKEIGSLRKAASAYLEHMIDEGRITDANGDKLEHSVSDLEILFPEAKMVTSAPQRIARDHEWVSKVWSATSKSPFSRIKSVAYDLTKDEARARGYIKGNKKIEEEFGLLKRVTTPQTVYKLQKLDRDDIIDITDFDVVAWIKAEMRFMLEEELARAVLIGDGRQSGDASKINESNIRPVLTDEDLYTYHHIMPDLPSDENELGRRLIKEALKARKNYKGSGSPTFYGDVDAITAMLLVEDTTGRRLYNTITDLASAIRVKEIIEVPVMSNLTRAGRSSVPSENGKTFKCHGLIVNMSDYKVGADRGGAVSLFDDFDLDYNKYEYLIETRCSGALYVPGAAISLESETVG